MEGWDGDEDNCPAIRGSWSPLSEVAVVRLVPDPLRSLDDIFRSLGGGGGAMDIGDEPPRSIPREAA